MTLRVEGPARALPSAVEVSLLRTSREALTNAARHAPGEPVTVALDFRGPDARLTVSNPTGLRSGNEPGGYGLTGARERLALVAGPVTPRELPDGLTQREAEVLGQIARGRTNAEIAAATVKTHINNAFAKIGARNRTEAATYAGRNGLS